MPKSNKSTFNFYDADGKVYPFYAKDKATAVRYALDWSRARGIRLYTMTKRRRK